MGKIQGKQARKAKNKITSSSIKMIATQEKNQKMFQQGTNTRQVETQKPNPVFKNQQEAWIR